MYFNKKLKTFFLSGLFICLFSMLSYGQNVLSIQVKENVTATERVMTFQNKIGKTAARIKGAEARMNNAKLKGVIKITIDPKTNQVVARLKKDIKKEDLDHFFGAMGYTQYTIR
jgi:hypothetical protein